MEHEVDKYGRGPLCIEQSGCQSLCVLSDDAKKDWCTWKLH